MKMIASLIGFFVATSEASNNRLLLQTQPATPVATPATTVYTYTYVPPPAAAAPVTELNCVIAAGQPGSCAGTVQEPPSIGYRFKAKCDGVASCAGATLNIFYPANNQYTEMTGMWFSAPHAAADAVVNVGNYNPTFKIDLKHVECSDPGSCFHTKFNFMGVNLGDFACGVPGACEGCTITTWDNPAHPHTVACESIAKLLWL